MTKNTKFRLTCFLCKYEITKQYKSGKQIKFIGKLKPICRNCTKKEHKVLNNQYENFDVQCKVCNKPSKYKNCIACSICNHIFHGKCLNLTKDDIIKIENVNNYYMCINCTNDILPQQFDSEFNEYISKSNIKHVKKVKPIHKQCLTCKTIVTKRIYPNKHLIYNEQRHLLCEQCSKHSTNIPVRDKNLIEFQDCSICSKQVKYESIYCNLCQHLVHPYCNGISKSELARLSKIDENWYCKHCNYKIFPKLLLKNKFKTIIKTKNPNIFQEFKTFNDCSVCSKLVTGTETLACSTCNHWVHKKCIGEFNNRTEFQNFLLHYSSKSWDCPACVSEMLPFTFLENDEFLMLLLDIYTKPTYLNKDNIKNVYIKLKSKEFFNTNNDKDNEQDKYYNEIDPDFNYFANDTCDYTIDSDDIVLQSLNNLTMMTFNIRSIKKNFDNFTQLIYRLKSKIHIICLTETWINELDNIDDFTLEGYHTPLYQNRPNGSQRGGVMTYIHKDIKNYKIVKNLSFADNFNHFLATEIQLKNKNITFLNIYRSPDNLNDTFLSKFESIIENIKSKLCYILGDMNYNLINIDKHTPTNEYYNLLTTASFKPLITKPTHITETNETLIDHIWTNNLSNTSANKSHIILTDISDHLPCITIVKSPDSEIKGYRYVTKRLINDNNRIEFNKRISRIKDILLFQASNKSEPNLETRYTNYFNCVSKIYNECFPLITKKVHSKTLCKPWITPHIQKLISKTKGFF